MIEVRAATSDDADALAELRWEFRAPLAIPTESHEAFKMRCGEWMRTELDSGRWRAWVATDGTRIVGQLWMHYMSKIPNPAAELERHAYISNVYVTPKSRGGIGTRLLDAAVAAARASGVDSVVLWPTDQSRTLYLKHGFAADGKVLTLKVG